MMAFHFAQDTVKEYFHLHGLDYQKYEDLVNSLARLFAEATERAYEDGWLNAWRNFNAMQDDDRCRP